MKTILILLDTVRKDYLSIYNSNTDVNTPNISNLAKDSYIFENHYTGSLPCMPARRDLFTGRLDFFERFWGGIEPFDILFPRELSMNKISSHIITDHHHYWHGGGEGYLQQFDTFEMYRGQESDSYVSDVDDVLKPDRIHGRYNKQYQINSSKFKGEEDYPTMKTFNSACDFLERNRNKENFFLQIEGFDPHEPFHTPQKYMDMYDVKDSDIDEFYNSPKYGELDDNYNQLEYIIKKYKANLTFADYALGKVIAKLKDLKIYDECNIIFTTDHGFHLGEHNSMGKGVNHIYSELSHIPLVHKKPFSKGSKRIKEMTQLIDIMPTLLDMYNIDLPNNLHGKSYRNILIDKEYVGKEEILSGYHGSSVMMVDREYTLYQGIKSECNSPLFHYTSIPTIVKGYIGSKYHPVNINVDDISVDRYFSRTTYPIFKIPISGWLQLNPNILNTELYDNRDVGQINNLKNERITMNMQQRLKLVMEKMEVPDEQFFRLGLK